MNYLSKDTVLATLTSFLSYFVMSAIISPLGIVSGALSAHYNISLTQATAFFSFLTTGILIGSLLTLVINPVLGAKRVILLSSASILLTFTLMRVIDHVSFLPIAFVSIGVCCGLLLASAAIVLTALYKEKHRPSALLATDSFYSFAGFATTPFVGIVVARSMHWSTAYGIAAVTLIAIVIIAAVTKFPDEVKAAQTDDKSAGRWPFATYMIGGALLIYLIAFVFIYTWAPAYASTKLALSPDETGLLVSKFFFGLFCSQLVMFFVALVVRAQILVTLISAVATIVSTGLWLSNTEEFLTLSLFALGLTTGGLLKVLIAYGTQIVINPTSRLIGFFMTCTAVGSSISPALGAYLVETLDMLFVLKSITFCFGIAFLLIALSVILQKNDGLWRKQKVSAS